MENGDLKNRCNQMREILEKIKPREDLWNLYTKKEEYNSPFSDKYDRFPYYLSKYKSVFNPTISEFLVCNNFDPEYPENRNFAVCLTHDIDMVYPSKSASSARALMQRKFTDAFKVTLSGVKKSWNPLLNFKEIMNLEEKYGAISSFYFLALDPGEEDFAFRVEDLENEIGNISDKGWEVGLHGGHESYSNLEDMAQKKKKLERVLGKDVIGYRNHYLRFRTPDTWELLSKAGFRYDSTFGYADCAGFRNGMCHPFRPYNLETGKEIKILEIPLTIMDRTILESYMKLDFKNAWSLTKKLVDTVEKCRGVITILWHNTEMRGEKLKFYEKLINYCSGKNAWLTNGEEICNFWESEVHN